MRASRQLSESSRDVTALGRCCQAAGLDGLKAPERDAGCVGQLSQGDIRALSDGSPELTPSRRAFVQVHLVERARMRRSRRRRASSIGGSSSRFRPICLRSSRTARTISETRSTGTLPFSSVNRVAVIRVDSCLLSIVVGSTSAWWVWRSPSVGDRPSAKVVAGVVERMGVRNHWHQPRRPRPRHSIRRGGSR
jgi:hypothetical protein